MGIDVYGFFQVRSGDRWTPAGGYTYSQRGALKLWLAPWNPPQLGIEPIAGWRGLPADLRRDGVPEEKNCSWLFADEILEALPLIERRTETLSEEEFQKMSQKEYWDYTFAPWVNPPPRFIAAHRRSKHSGTETEKFEVEFLLDISDEVKEFTDKVLELKKTYSEVRYVFEYR